MLNFVNISGGVLILIVVITTFILRNKKTVLDKKYFMRRWTKLQKLCSSKKTWYQAVIEADNLLDEALKKRHFHGKTTGERLVSAQHFFTSNDAVWLSHKLKNKITDHNYRELSRKDTLEALAAFRLALKDLGALGPDKKGKKNA